MKTAATTSLPTTSWKYGSTYISSSARKEIEASLSCGSSLAMQHVKLRDCVSDPRTASLDLGKGR